MKTEILEIITAEEKTFRDKIEQAEKAINKSPGL